MKIATSAPHSLSPKIVSYFTILIILIIFPSCGINSSSDKKGTPLWLSGGNGVNNNTASVASSPNSPSPNPYSQTTNTPTKGFYFLHPDHLGSITMITDGASLRKPSGVKAQACKVSADSTKGGGNVVSGGTFGGKSNIVYKSYGEIDREKSSGPDITRYKYTGQEEDKETGLYYYKARYYDPAIGRYLQADSLVDSKRNFGMNRYMYVDGNPTKYRDKSGKDPIGNFFNDIFKKIFQPINIDLKKFWKSATNMNDVHRVLGGDVSTRGVLRNKPREELRLAVIGYHLGGYEGALAGYFYGSSLNKKRIHKRQERASNTYTNIGRIATLVVAGVNVYELEKKTFEKVFGSILSDVLIGAGLEYATDSTGPFQFSYEVFADVCALNFFAHLDKSNVNNDSFNTALDGACIFSEIVK